MKSNNEIIKKAEAIVKELKDYIEFEKLKNRLFVSDITDKQEQLITAAKKELSEIK